MLSLLSRLSISGGTWMKWRQATHKYFFYFADSSLESQMIRIVQ